MTVSKSTQTAFTKFAGLNGQPSALERRLIDACFVGRHGEGRELAIADDLLDCATDQQGNLLFKLPEGEHLEIAVSPDLITALATGTFKHPDWPDWVLHSNGVNLAGAVIPDHLNLSKQQVPVDLYFEDCFFLAGCSFKGASLAGGLNFISCWVQSQLDLSGTDIHGAAKLSNCDFTQSKGTALHAPDLRARGLDISNSRCKGGINITGSVIDGPVDARCLSISAPEKLAFDAAGVSAKEWRMQSAKIIGNVHLKEAKMSASCNISKSSIDGTLNMASAHISGLFSAQGVTIHAPSKSAIVAPLCKFDGGAFLRNNVRVEGSVNFSGSTVERAFELSDALFTGDRNFAIRLDGVRVNGQCQIENSTIKGLMYAARISISDKLSFSGSKMSANCACEQVVGNKVEDLSESSATNLFKKLHPVALSLKDARIDGRLTLPETLVSGQIDLSHARCSVFEDYANSWPPAIPDRRIAAPERMAYDNDGVITDAQYLVLDGFTYDYFEHPDGEPFGEEFSTSQDIAAARVRWLLSQSVADLHGRFNPQPWRQAAGVLRNMGHDRASQIVTIQRRVRERYSKDTPWRQKLVNRALHLISDYGYNPWKTVVYCLLTILVFSGIHWGAVALCGNPKDASIASQCNAPLYAPVRYGDVDPEQFEMLYPEFDPISYSLGSFIPLFDLGSEPYWRPNTSSSIRSPGSDGPVIPAGWILYWLFVFERILGGVLIAIAITGFTGMLSREEK